MLEFIIIAGIAYLVLKGGHISVDVATAPVINQAVGGSLSGALGNQAKVPGYYATGNPGYATQNAVTGPAVAGTSVIPNRLPTGVSQQPGSPIIQRPTAPRTPILIARNSGGVVGNQTPPPVIAPSLVAIKNPATGQMVLVNPALTQGTVATTRNSPEVASPFWAPNPRIQRLT